MLVKVPVVLDEPSDRGANEEYRNNEQSGPDDIENKAFRDQEHQKSDKYRHQAFCEFGRHVLLEELPSEEPVGDLLAFSLEEHLVRQRGDDLPDGRIILDNAPEDPFPAY